MSQPAEADETWRIEEHDDVEVWTGDRLVATFVWAVDAVRACIAVNGEREAST